MEFYKKINDISYFKLHGNIIIYILNKYEDGCIDKKYIINEFNLQLLAYNPNNIYLDKICYASFVFKDGVPIITCGWEYNSSPTCFYPLRKIKQETLDCFKIDKQIHINYNELYRNIKMLDDEYEMIMLNNDLLSIIPTKKKINIPNFINKFGNIYKYKENEIVYDDINISDIEYDETGYSTESSLSDESQYN